MSMAEAALYRRRFFETYPGLKRWHERERRAWLRGDTETRTLTGRRRMDIERLTNRLNAPVQGTGADGLKLARLKQELGQSQAELGRQKRAPAASRASRPWAVNHQDGADPS
jgi:DNA polymerase I-like protein with 3'-5' exonuclease and polymerase domains